MRKYLTVTNVLKAILSVAGMAYVIICEVEPFWVFFIALLLVWREDWFYVNINIGNSNRDESDKEAV